MYILNPFETLAINKGKASSIEGNPDTLGYIVIEQKSHNSNELKSFAYLYEIYKVPNAISKIETASAVGGRKDDIILKLTLKDNSIEYIIKTNNNNNLIVVDTIIKFRVSFGIFNVKDGIIANILDV